MNTPIKCEKLEHIFYKCAKDVWYTPDKSPNCRKEYNEYKKCLTTETITPKSVSRHSIDLKKRNINNL
jgi:hypothetical protein